MGRLAAVDIETTGLDPATDLILEVGAVVFDSHLQPVISGAVIVATHAAVDWAFDTFFLHDDELSPAQAMHIRNGLVDDLMLVDYHLGSHRFCPDDADTFTVAGTLADADAWMANFLAENGVAGPVPMVGSSVRSLDAPFLSAHMPHTSAVFNHRTIDASALMELARFTDPPAYGEIDALVGSAEHRTVSDCHRSLNLIRSFATRYGVGNDMVR
ncbi:exonuclease [Mycobacterium koreense]|uniref:Uncharacterized protein n=1 Tax=Mycolicibacillus koreensis TaxID=1069220 RepID=A0AA91SSI1_9MYCO|nr:exonuclease domain-containing protein [Mycolicibacillus koreensis]MCV7247814.1 exonuclease [Mycolicibacillus koreensis]OSC34795.1 hypothetical protein B8W67_05330 [Mycolicibacillus koreensis]